MYFPGWEEAEDVDEGEEPGLFYTQTIAVYGDSTRWLMEFYIILVIQYFSFFFLFKFLILLENTVFGQVFISHTLMRLKRNAHRYFFSLFLT